MARALSIGSVLAALFLGVLALEPSAAFGQSSISRVFVEITEDGYEPKTLHILQGTEVVWTNIGAKEHWPASNNHPSHTRYPGSSVMKCGTEEEAAIFDACRGLTPGESWSFVFEKAGEWRYHDHLYPSLGGTMYVFKTESERASAASGAEKISFSERLIRFFSGWFRSIGKFLRLLPPPEMPSIEEFRLLPESERETILLQLIEYDAREAWEYLKRAAYENGTQVFEAHELAHLAGNALYRERGFRGMASCSSEFAYGCYHGVSEEFLTTEGPEKLSEAASICKELFPGETERDRYLTCIHGFGHGLLTWHGLDLDAALRSCGMLPKETIYSCYDGVFMEFSFSATREQYPIDNPWSLCENKDSDPERERDAAIACARYQPELMRLVLGFSIEQAAAQCLIAPDLNMREHCTTMIGFHAAWQHSDDAGKAVSFCDALYPENPAFAWCIIAATREYIFQEFPDWQSKSTALCEILSGAERDECYRAREQGITEFENKYK